MLLDVIVPCCDFESFSTSMYDWIFDVFLLWGQVGGGSPLIRSGVALQ